MATSGNHDIVLPPEFSGEAQLILYTRYGDPMVDGWENKWITNWEVQDLFPWFPVKQIRIHKHFRPLLNAAFTYLEEDDLYKEIRTFEEGFNLRNIKGSMSVLSVHSWGAAIDMNTEDNPLGSTGKWTKEFIEAMTMNQIYCGQNWSGRKDPMHFAMIDG